MALLYLGRSALDFAGMDGADIDSHSLETALITLSLGSHSVTTFSTSHQLLSLYWSLNSAQSLASVWGKVISGMDANLRIIDHLSSFKFYDPSFYDSTTIFTYSPHPFSYYSSYNTHLWEERRQQDVYLDLTDNKKLYASRIQDQSRRTWPSPPGSSLQ